MSRNAYGGDADEDEVDSPAEGLNLPGRTWPMKTLLIGYEQCCIDRLSRQGKADIDQPLLANLDL